MASNEGPTVTIERNSEEHQHIREAMRATDLAVAWAYRGRTRVHIWKGDRAICGAPYLHRNYNRAVDTEGWCPDCLRKLEVVWRKHTGASESDGASAPAAARMRQTNPKEQTRYTDYKAVWVLEGKALLNEDPREALQEAARLLTDAYPGLELQDLVLQRSGHEVARLAQTREAPCATSPSGSTPTRSTISRPGQLPLAYPVRS